MVQPANSAVSYRIETNAEDVMKGLKKFGREVPEAADDMMQELADLSRQRLQQSLTQEGAVSTGQGLYSIKPEKMGEGSYIVSGVKYLDYVDRGTLPHYPEVDARFRYWARKNNWDVDALVKHIGAFGTEANPFIDKALDPILKAVTGKGDKALKQAKRESGM